MLFWITSNSGFEIPTPRRKLCKEFWLIIAELILEKLLVAQLNNKFPAFYKTQISLQFKKKLSNDPYTQPNESNPKYLTLFLDIFKYYTFTCGCLFQAV
jgi:hypothetical protein